MSRIEWPSEIVYSQKYCDENYEFRHVILTEEVFYCIPKKRVLSEQEWRQYFVMSGGWENYAIHKPEPYILLFRRPIGTNPDTGKVDPELAKIAKLKYQQELARVCNP